MNVPCVCVRINAPFIMINSHDVLLKKNILFVRSIYGSERNVRAKLVSVSIAVLALVQRIISREHAFRRGEKKNLEFY